MKFQQFSQNLREIEETSSRNQMINTVVGLLKKLSKDEVDQAMYLMQGRVVPRFIDIEFNVARKLMIRALAKAFAKDEKEVDKIFKERGDLGLVGEELNEKKTSTISIKQAFDALYQIAILGGKESQQAKIDGLAKLLKSSDQLSCKYIIRIVIGNLRLGISDKSVLDALSIFAISDKSKRKDLDKAYGVRGDIGFIAEEVVKGGMKSVEKLDVTVGVPVTSMLCEREDTEKKILERMHGRILIQPKYDGLRTQIHYDAKGFEVLGSISRAQAKLLEEGNKNIRIFSRNLENLTRMFPEVSKVLPELKIDSIVLDAEAVGFDYKKNKILPFQETIQRRRKYDVKRLAKTVPVKIFAFDVLYLNGKSLIETPQEERIKILQDVLEKSPKQDIIVSAPTEVVKTESEFEKFFKGQVAEGLEGIIAKAPGSDYQPGKRGYDWIKFKKSTKGFVVDTVDAVVLGYYSGRGARAAFGIGALLIGVYNKEKKRFETIAKVGTGITDEQWPVIKKRLDSIAIDKPRKDVIIKKELMPDILVRPEVVVVVEADEVTKSSNHTAGWKNNKGYSLRFPRLKQFDRKDKNAEQVNTTKEIIKMHSFGKK